MTEINNIQQENELTGASEHKSGADPQLTVPYLLTQIASVADNIGYLKDVISELKQTATGNPGDISGAAKAEALADAIKCRETTNQQLLRLYEKMYDDIKPLKNNTRERLIDLIEKIAGNSEIDNVVIDTLLKGSKNCTPWDKQQPAAY